MSLNEYVSGSCIYLSLAACDIADFTDRQARENRRKLSKHLWQN